MEILEIIKQNHNWRDVLSSKPYCLDIKEDERYVLFKYNQIDSDFSLRIVRESRGIIFRKSDWKCVCRKFDKFFNVQEGYSSEIDWSSAMVQEKLDGSLIALWFDDNEWHVSTNGTIDAFQASLQNDLSPYKTFGDLFISVFPQEYFYSILETNKTYIFELVSPYNRVVVPYQKTEIWHIGTRNNDTLEESDDDIGIQKPKGHNLYSLDECLQVAENLPFSEEGYVVVDAHWNRVKIKSPAYVAAHHLKNNGVITYSRVLDMIKVGGDDDFISIYPEYREVFKTVKDKLISFIDDCLEILREFHNVKFETRKEFATWATTKRFPSLLFLLLDEKIGKTSDDVGNYILSIDSDKLLKMIGVKE